MIFVARWSDGWNILSGLIFTRRKGKRKSDPRVTDPWREQKVILEIQKWQTFNRIVVCLREIIIHGFGVNLGWDSKGVLHLLVDFFSYSFDAAEELLWNVLNRFEISQHREDYNGKTPGLRQTWRLTVIKTTHTGGWTTRLPALNRKYDGKWFKGLWGSVNTELQLFTCEHVCAVPVHVWYYSSCATSQQPHEITGNEHDNPSNLTSHAGPEPRTKRIQ